MTERIQEDHKGSIIIEDVQGTTHVRIEIDGLFLDTEEGKEHVEALASKGVQSLAVLLLMRIVEGLAKDPNSTRVSGGYPNESTVH